MKNSRRGPTSASYRAWLAAAVMWFVLIYVRVRRPRSWTFSISDDDCDPMFLAPSRKLPKPRRAFDFFFGAKERPHSFPFASGDGFRAFADCVYDETVSRPWTSQDCPPHSIVFVKADALDEFVASVVDGLRSVVVLVHNGDASSPDGVDVGSPNVLKWFVANPSIGTDAESLPIGLQNHHHDARATKELFRAYAYADASRGVSYPFSIYVSLGRSTPEREIALERVRRDANPTLLRIDDRRVSRARFYATMAESDYVLAPPGNGLDTHRAWEAMILGARAIVVDSPLNALHDATGRATRYSGDSALDVDAMRSMRREDGEAWPPKEALLMYWLDRVVEALDAPSDECRTKRRTLVARRLVEYCPRSTVNCEDLVASVDRRV